MFGGADCDCELHNVEEQPRQREKEVVVVGLRLEGEARGGTDERLSWKGVTEWRMLVVDDVVSGEDHFCGGAGRRWCTDAARWKI